MKTFKPVLNALVVSLFIGAIPAAGQDSDGPRFEFREDSHDFGDLEQGEKAEHIFSFKNTGNQPLLISNILTTCGCTAPSWPKEPIPPGGSGAIKVLFNSAGKMGKQNKVITIFSNSVNEKDRITIRANIIPGY